VCRDRRQCSADRCGDRDLTKLALPPKVSMLIDRRIAFARLAATFERQRLRDHGGPGLSLKSRYEVGISHCGSPAMTGVTDVKPHGRRAVVIAAVIAPVKHRAGLARPGSPLPSH
jgi:hypothetical protein